MKSPHLAALGWIIALGFTLSLVLGAAALMIRVDSFADTSEITLKASLNGLSNLALITAVIAILCAITLAGIRHFIAGALQVQREERAEERDSAALPAPALANSKPAGANRDDAPQPQA